MHSPSVHFWDRDSNLRLVVKPGIRSSARKAAEAVIVAAGATTTEFIASVVPPGALVLLPEKASALVEKTWQSVPELAVSIMENNRALRGVVSIKDISNAVQELQTNCPTAVRGRKQDN